MQWPEYKKLNREQFWILPSGMEIRGKDAHVYLTDKAQDLQFNIKALELLSYRLSDVLKGYKPSENIINDVMDMDEIIANAEVFYGLYKDSLNHRKLF